MAEHQETNVQFTALATGGEAVGRDETGRAVFAPYAAPGDRAAVSLQQAKVNFARGQLTQLLEFSPHRIVAPCPFFRPPVGIENPVISPDWTPSDTCGGCAWQHLEYSHQLQAKSDIVAQALKRIGQIADADEKVEACVASPPFSYRNKADFVFDASTRTIGFYAPNSHSPVDISQCLIVQPPINEVLNVLRVRSEELFDCDVKSAVVRVSSPGQTLLVLESESATSQLADIANEIQAQVSHLCGVLLRSAHKVSTLCGQDYLIERVLDNELRVGGDGFFQVNTALTPRMVELALEMAQLQNDESVLDAFCGVGLFALAFARAGADVTGIEANAAAIENACLNAEHNRLKARFHVGDVARILRREKHLKFNVAVLDPPRAGAASAVAEIAKRKPRCIVYVSCDPATLARDVKSFGLQGYALQRAVPLDLFPQTAHVETIACLRLMDK